MEVVVVVEVVAMVAIVLVWGVYVAQVNVQ